MVLLIDIIKAWFYKIKIPQNSEIKHFSKGFNTDDFFCVKYQETRKCSNTEKSVEKRGDSRVF